MKRLLLICAFVAWSANLLAAVTAAQLKTALDSPADVTFVVGGGLTIRSNGVKFGSVEGGVVCTGGTFLEMAGSTDKARKPRANRIVSAFDVQVKESGVLFFDICAAVWGDNDDVLVVYEDDIDDPLAEFSGDYWSVAEKDEDGDYWFDKSGDDFFYSYSIMVGTDHYSHTLHFAVLKALDDENYEKPVLKDPEMGINIFLPSRVWLDNFEWEPDDMNSLLSFFPESGAQFGGYGLNVFLDTSYDMDALSFYYTTNGSVPSNKSTKYDPENDDGIELTKTTTLKVAVYEGATLIDNTFSATYTRLPAPPAPTAQIASASPFADALTVNFSCKESGVRFAYTLDGSVPTDENYDGIANSVTVSKPCTVNVVSLREGETSANYASVVVEKTPTPQVTWFADGVATKSPVVYDNGASMTATAASGTCYYRKDGGAPVKGTSTNIANTVRLVEVQAVEANKLPSDIVSATFEQTQADEWVKASDFVAGWQLWAVPKKLSNQQGKALAAWLKPYGVDPSRRTLELVDKVEGGRAYWVLGPIQGKPSVTLRTGGDVAPLGGSTWRLVSTGALWVWDLEKGIFVPASADDQPGFVK